MMDPTQLPNRNAAAQYLATIDQARTPEMAVKVIGDALADKDMFSFAELYAKKPVQDLKSTDASIWVNVLEIFMWGTYQDFEQLSNKPTLSAAQQLKLRQLTLVTLASHPTSASSITQKVDQKLFIPNVREALYLKSNDEVGPIFIKAIEHKLFDGSVDNANKMLEIKAIHPSRDLNPSELSSLNDVLGKWIDRAEQELGNLNKTMDGIRMEAKLRRETEASDADKLEGAINESTKNNRKRGSGNEGLDAGVGSSRNIRQR